MLNMVVHIVTTGFLKKHTRRRLRDYHYAVPEILAIEITVAHWKPQIKKWLREPFFCSIFRSQIRYINSRKAMCAQVLDNQHLVQE
jgi:hypothetical protein